MLGFLRRGQRFLTVAIVVGIGGVFVFYMGWGAPRSRPSAGTLVQVGPYRFGAREFMTAREDEARRLEQIFGDNFDRRRMRDFIDQQTAQSLVQQALFAMEGEQLGLRVGKREIERSVLDIRDETGRPAFVGDDGSFDRERFRNWVEYNYGNERNFAREQSMRLLRDRTLRLMTAAAEVSEAEARQALRQRLEEVRIAFVTLDTAKTPEHFRAEPDEVTLLLETRPGDVQKLYEERADRYDAPERVHARHILLAAPEGADEAAWEAARERAAAVLERLRAGEAFAAVARETSDDAESKLRGGDLGFVVRGELAPAVEEAAFAQEPGTPGEPLRSERGYHVIEVIERQEARSIPFEEVREELAGEILEREAARAAARERAEQLAARVSAGESLEAAARSLDLTLERSGLLRRRPDGFVPGLGAAPDLLATAFGLEAGASSPRIFEVGEQLALVQVLERREPGEAEIAEQLEAERESLLRREREAQVSAWLEARQAALRESGELQVDFAAIQDAR